MRTEAEIRFKLDKMIKEQKEAFACKNWWFVDSNRPKIQALEWVLGGDDK